jgi:hypothetical protein
VQEAEGQKGKMDGTTRRGIVICNDVHDSSSQIESGKGRQKATDPVQIRLTQSAWWWLRASQLLWVKGTNTWYGFGLNRHPCKQFVLVGPASEVLHKIHERRSLIVISRETCQ